VTRPKTITEILVATHRDGWWWGFVQGAVSMLALLLLIRAALS
jgi:hypothetical protein